jgi:3'(2'), 5'-bisphosphate nucleotidase
MDAAARATLLQSLTEISVCAALAIRDAAGKNGVRHKTDGSPVTAADLVAEAAIRDGLSALAAPLPIVSEEEAQHPRLLSGSSYFLIDPLDGTREFIAGSAEYAINIALMMNSAPVLGVIAAPALGLIWRGNIGQGAERLAFAADGAISSPSPIHTRLRPPREPVVLVSRSHLDARTQAYLGSLPRPTIISCGSAVKFCRIAEGSADLYPRLAPTHDWDVAAGHAIIEAAGGRVLTPDGAAIRYGTPDLLIRGFIASGDADGP